MDRSVLTSILQGSETTPYGIRSRLTDESTFLAKRLLGRQKTLGLEPITAPQRRFQAFLAWCIWGQPAGRPGDPAGVSRRATSYTFTHSQGRDYWQIRDVSRYFHNLADYVVGGKPLPGFTLRSVAGRDIELDHDPTGGKLLVRVNDDWVIDSERLRAHRLEAGYWQPMAPSPWLYEAVPGMTDDCTTLLASTLNRLLIWEDLHWMSRPEHRLSPGGPLDKLYQDGEPYLQALSAGLWLLDGTRRDRAGGPACSYPVLAGLFSHPRFLPKDCTYEHITGTRGVLRSGGAELWVIGVDD